MIQKKLLIVDDEEAIRYLLEQGFSRAGYEVASAPSAEHALELLEKEKFHVFFLDLKLPEMDGIELCSQIKNNIPMSIIFAVTGYASLFELADCRTAGFDDYFKKPIKMSTLIQAAETAFERIDRWKKI